MCYADGTLSTEKHSCYLLCLQEKLRSSLFPPDFRKYVCPLLDVEDRIHQKDWTRVAEKGLGLTLIEIRCIRDLKESAGRSPTEKLLNLDERNGVEECCLKNEEFKCRYFLKARDTQRIAKN